MPFAARNAYYLRISPYSVLPLYLYLDERHISWMSDGTLQLILEDLRHRVGPKLRAESHIILSNSASVKQKPGVDVCRGTSYQFAYFLRRADPQTILVKHRSFRLRPVATQPPSKDEPRSPLVSSPSRRATGREETEGPRQGTTSSIRDSQSHAPDEEQLDITWGSHRRRSGRARTVINGSYVDEDEDKQYADMNQDDIFEPASVATGEGPTTGSGLTRSPVAETKPDLSYRAANLTHSVQSAAPIEVIDFTQTPDDEEDKPKPELMLTFSGFSIFGCALCVIAEPFPPLRNSVVPTPRQRQASLPTAWRSSLSRSMSVEPTSELERGRTPLFRPETPFDEEQTAIPERYREYTPLFRLETPEPEMRGGSLVPSLRGRSPSLAANEEEEEDEAGSTMIEFSQVLSSAGTGRFGGSHDVDDEGGEGFYGDADEAKDNV